MSTCEAVCDTATPCPPGQPIADVQNSADTRRIAIELNVVGLMNIQYAIQNNTVYESAAVAEAPTPQLRSRLQPRSAAARRRARRRSQRGWSGRSVCSRGCVPRR